VGRSVGTLRSSSLLMRRALSSDRLASMLLLALLTFRPRAPMKLSFGAKTVLRGRSLTAGLKLGWLVLVDPKKFRCLPGE